MENRSEVGCEIDCHVKQTGRCALAMQVRNQAEAGSCHPSGANHWPRSNWENYLARVNSFAASCQQKEQLALVVATVKPVVIEDEEVYSG